MTSWGRGRRVAGVGILAALIVAGVVFLSSSGSSRHGGVPAPVPPAPVAPAPAPPAPVAPAPAPRVARSSEQFGVNVNRLFDDRIYSATEIDGQLAALRATGATLARSDALWEAVEPTAPVAGVHHYNWSFDDLVVGSLARHGLRWLPIIDYSAPWARARPQLLHSPPRTPGEFAAFAGAFATRYGRGGTFWREHRGVVPVPVDTYEVWNEPDNGEFWQPVPDAAAYADLYLATRVAVASADPSARVIVGGLTRAGTFLPEMVQARPQLRRALDGVAIHPYGANPFVVLARVRQARETLSSLRLAKVHLYVTEFGWVTHPPGALNYVPEKVRPGYIAAAVAALGHTNCRVAATVLYTWVTPQQDPADKEDWYGIHPPGGGSSADVAAFAAGLRKATVPAPRERICGTT